MNLLDTLGLSELKIPLTKEEEERLVKQLDIYAPFLREQRALIHKKTVPSTLPPCTHFFSQHSCNTEKEGRSWISQGKVAVLILAGGQGSRLKAGLPKGLIKVSPVSGKTLFEILCEKIKAAAQFAQVDIPVAIMTSSFNHEETVAFFKQHHNFGLSLSFFQQGNLPFITKEGQWLYDSPGSLAVGPDGNGHALHLLVKNGIYELWKERGIEHVSTLFVDNPLAHPLDPSFIGLACKTDVDALLKAVQRSDPYEKMGVIGQGKEGIRVIEYSELPYDPSPYTLSSIGIFCVKMSLIPKLPPFKLHLAWKEVKLSSQTQLLGKCERFLFDLLEYSKKSAVFVAPREMTYAPLKDQVGERDLKSVQNALIHYNRLLYKKITGKDPGNDVLELPADFEYI